jgi:tetratricopeptide (TPR) repeat protein
VISTPDQSANQKAAGEKRSDAASSIPAWRLALALAALAIVAYCPALRAGFIWDDDSYVTQNTTLHALEGLRQIWFHPGKTPQFYPLVHTSFWIEYHLWGLNPAGYHAVNVLLHAFGAILLWRALRRLEVPGAWLAAALFAVHPIEVESVAWITERKNVLSAVFYFAATLMYLRFFELSDTPADRRRRAGFYVGAVALFVAALWSKTVTCSLPAALLLARWWKTGTVRWRDVSPLAPFFVIGAGLGLLTAWLEKHHVGAAGGEWTLTFPERVCLAGRALWFYAGKLAWPARLAFIYPRWNVASNSFWPLFPLAAAGVVAALWFARRRIGRGPLAAVLFFAGTAGPSLGFFDVYPFRYSFVADHFQYLAGVGLIVLAAAGLSRAPKIISAAVLLLLGVLTWQQAGIYKNLETLWRDTLAKNPDSWLAHNNLGLELEYSGRLDEALFHYREAQRVRPEYFETYHNLGNLFLRRGRPQEAIQNFQEMVQLNRFPETISAANNGIGVAYGMAGDYDTAIEYFRTALEVNPGYAEAEMNWGNALKMQGKSDEAIGHFQRAVQFAPRDAEAHFRLASMLAQLGRNPEAMTETQATLQLRPDYPEARRLLQELQSPAGP